MEALIEAVTDTLAEVKAKALLNALGDTVAEVEAETLYKTLHDMRAETLVEVLLDTLAKKRGRHSWWHKGRSKNQGAARHAGLHASLGGGRGTSRHGGCHASISKGRDTWQQWESWKLRHCLKNRLTRYQAQAVVDTPSFSLSEVAEKTFFLCRARGHRLLWLTR